MCNIESNQKEEISSNTSSTCSRTNNAPRSTPTYPSSPPVNVYQNHNSHLNSPPVMIPSYDSQVRLPQLPVMPNITFNESQSDRNCQSPLPRRKQVRVCHTFYQVYLIRILRCNNLIFFTQARPRRRSGESFGPQDLSNRSSQQSDSETAENLSMKKSPNHRSVTPTRSPSRTQTSPNQHVSKLT